jgi:hypothetical protein
VLTFQFGGSSKGSPPEGERRGLFLAKVSDAEPRDGPRHPGDGHTQPQGRVEIIDFDINRASPYRPKRRSR